MSETNPVHVSVRARRVIDNHNGTFTIELAGRDLSAAEQKVLEDLFPNLLEKAGVLLNQEALIQSLATPSEITAKPPEPEKASVHKPKY